MSKIPSQKHINSMKANLHQDKIKLKTSTPRYIKQLNFWKTKCKEKFLKAARKKQ